MPITRLPLAELAGSTDPGAFPGRRTLSDVNRRIAKAKKVIVVSGAGISCSSGIPDFRSEDGLYSLVKAKYPDSFVAGKDLFSSGLFTTPHTTSIFYTFIAELSLACQAAQPTRTHHFIRRLENKGKLLRSYTQNVDGFERRLGIESGGRGTGLKKNGTRNVELHGDLGRVRCVLCSADFEAREEWVNMFREGEAPPCPSCEERHSDRVNRGARPTSIGSLRPSIVLYDEAHPLGDQIGELQAYDMRRRPEVLLVMGTSLKVHGLKHLVKDFARAVHERKGIVVFVNATPPSKEWESVIDYHVEGDCDCFVEGVEEDWKRIRPQDWEHQTILDASVVHTSIIKGKAKSKPKAQPPSDDACHLPTPPASQQSREASSSPRRSPRHLTPKRSSSSLPPGSSPLTPLPSPLNSPSPTKTPAGPPTPVSPSKRSASRTGVPAQSKRSKTKPLTPSPSHGRGNLFGDALSTNVLSSDDQLSSEDVFNTKRMTRSSSIPRMPKTKATAVTAARLARTASGSAATLGADENGVTAPATRRRACAADKELSGRPMRRTTSLRAS